jgi:UDP-hydrolysing UDP-N-acetyl-D-glucosamine 2-epimerase
VDLRLFVTGMHLVREFGLTIRDIEADGFPIAARVEGLLASDTPEGIAKAMGLVTLGFAQVYARTRPDILLVLGDRFEMHAAAVAAVPFAIPLGHIAGGESSEGVIDEALRHAITKMSHLHFVANVRYARRLIQMGEEPWRITVSGSPALDNLRELERLSKEDLETRFGLDLSEPPLLVTYHPATLEYECTAWQVTQLLQALESVGRPVIFSAPNADTGGRTVRAFMEAYVATHSKTRLVVNLGTQAYFSLLPHCACLVGNSSSGIIEAASFRLPVVNVGERQRGRLHGKNVIDCGATTEYILRAVREALEPKFRARLRDLENPYGDGHAAERIVDRVVSVSLTRELLAKHFHEWPEAARIAVDAAGESTRLDG